MLTLQGKLKTTYIAKTTTEKLKIHPNDERTLLVDYFQHKYDRLCQCPKGMKWTLTTERWGPGTYDKAVAVGVQL